MIEPRVLIVLSVVEIVALMAVLAFFLVVLSAMLRHVAGNLHRVACGVWGSPTCPRIATAWA